MHPESDRPRRPAGWLAVLALAIGAFHGSGS
jgi:hypothetical protein